VLSLQVQAAMPAETPWRRNQFRVLVRHIFARFFENDLISFGDQFQTRIVQSAVAVAIPGLLWVMFQIASYHGPHPKPFWMQASDHYFFVTFSMVVMGAATVLEWDLLFPDTLDAFVLTTLPIAARTLFLARVSALGLLLGIFLFAANTLGAIFLCLWYWSMARSAEWYVPGYLGHLGPHLAAVLAGGLFAAALAVALQGLLLNLLGESLFRTISPALQGLGMMLLLIVLFLFPLLSGLLQSVLASDSSAVLWFPPFWFLGIYERLLEGSSAAPIFRDLARIGCWALSLALGLLLVTYPLAYRRKLRRAIEGAPARRKPTPLHAPVHAPLHGPLHAPLCGLLYRTVLRTPERRAIYHFISQTLLRVERHRLYLAAYGGLGLSLVVSSAVGLRLAHHHAALVLSPYGLLAAVPIAAFWTVAGLRTALLSPIDRRGNWLFRAIDGRPGGEHLAATRVWVLLQAAAITALVIVMLRVLAPAEVRGVRGVAAQCLVGFGLCLLLTDGFFWNVLMIPFTAPRVRSSVNLAFLIPAYVVLFPPLVWTTVEHEPWLAASLWHLLTAAALILAADYGLRAAHRHRFREEARLLEIEDEEEWPPRLGLG
ncbi:MAG TPA: hypothetical protein VGR96_02920, partial [Acidobacteriaceae bacterium]|nr:hypothetical protein [Acidobacteriaceae bacterium]